MCGRYALTSPGEVLAELLATDDVPPLKARYNIAPTQPVPIVRGEGNRRVWREVRWGLVPAWARDATAAARHINARSETLLEKPSFRDAFARPAGRCLIPADGFYEWKEFGRRKQAFFARRRDRRPMVFAGLWDRWPAPDAVALETCAVITCPANEDLVELHDRMPALLLSEDDFERWLTSESADDLLAQLRPSPLGEIEWHAVGRAVHDARHDAHDCLDPVVASSPTELEPTPEPAQRRLFD